MTHVATKMGVREMRSALQIGFLVCIDSAATPRSQAEIGPRDTLAMMFAPETIGRALPDTNCSRAQAHQSTKPLSAAACRDRLRGPAESSFPADWNTTATMASCLRFQSGQTMERSKPRPPDFDIAVRMLPDFPQAFDCSQGTAQAPRTKSKDSIARRPSDDSARTDQVQSATRNAATWQPHIRPSASLCTAEVRQQETRRLSFHGTAA